MRPALLLAYHGLGSLPRRLDPHNLMLEPARFSEQMLGLRRRGYRFVTLSEYSAQLEQGPPEGICALTFDDATLDNLTVLAPLLERLAAPCTVFACPGLLGRAHFAMPSESGVRMMDAEELRELAAEPLVEIGSHTNTHTNLSASSYEDALSEMTSSKAALEDLLQRSVSAFAYPECGYSPECPRAAADAGYEVAVTCAGLGGARPLELSRESIDSLDGRLSFALKSRLLYRPLRGSGPGRLARVAVRRLRHRGR